MKRYAIPFALLVGLILILVGALPQFVATAQCNPLTGGCAPPPPPPPPVEEKVRKKKPTAVPTSTATATPTAVTLQPYPSPYPSPYPGPTKYPGPKPTKTPIPFPPPTLPPPLACGWPCTIFGPVHIGDPVELGAGGLVVVSLLAGLFVFVRGRISLGNLSAPKGGTTPEDHVGDETFHEGQ